MKVLLQFVLFFSLIVSVSTVSLAQLTKIMGVVLDDATGEPIPFANVYFNNTTIGISAGFEGEFSIEADTPEDTLVASAVGYYKSYMHVRKGVFQKVEFRLKPSEYNLNEVEIFAEANPALIIFNRMIQNKPNNNPKDFDFFEYRLYNKVEVDANNVNDGFRKSRFLKNWRLFFNISTRPQLTVNPIYRYLLLNLLAGYISDRIQEQLKR